MKRKVKTKRVKDLKKKSRKTREDLAVYPVLPTKQVEQVTSPYGISNIEPYFKEGTIEVYNGDILTIDSIRARSVDLIVR